MTGAQLPPEPVQPIPAPYGLPFTAVFKVPEGPVMPNPDATARVRCSESAVPAGVVALGVSATETVNVEVVPVTPGLLQTREVFPDTSEHPIPAGAEPAAGAAGGVVNT